MGNALKAIEVSGVIDEHSQLCLDEPLRIAGPSRVRVIILFDNGTDEASWLATAAANPAFDFLKEPQEDIYTHADGTLFNDAR